MAHFPNKLVVGLTGCIASGKTTALKLFAKNHWNTISTDQIVNRLWAENDRLISSAQDRWGKDEIFSLEELTRVVARIIFKNLMNGYGWKNSSTQLFEKDGFLKFGNLIAIFVVELPLLFEKLKFLFYTLSQCL